MSSFVLLTNRPSDKLTRHEHSFHNETVATPHLDISYYDDDEIAASQNMNGSLLLATLSSSGNSSMFERDFVDKKWIHDLTNVSLAISKVNFLNEIKNDLLKVTVMSLNF
jgi:hypothetical protein